MTKVIEQMRKEKRMNDAERNLDVDMFEAPLQRCYVGGAGRHKMNQIFIADTSVVHFYNNNLDNHIQYFY